MQSRFDRFLLLTSVVAVVALLATAGAVTAVEPDGELLYRTYCTSCHGLTGTGSGINIPDMTVQPRDHTDPSEMGARSDEELALAIREGGPAVGKSVLMPPWAGILDEVEIAALIRHLRTLSGTSGTSIAHPMDIPAQSQEHAAEHASGHDPDHGPTSNTQSTTGPKTRVASTSAPLDVDAPPPSDALRKRYPGATTFEFEIRVEERELTVAPGLTVKVWGFNGQVPGPLIHIREGDEVIAKFVNLSSMDHTIHWHGMHQMGTWQSDGVPGITQEPVPPGGSFTYRFIATRPGTLWYHCHVNVPEHVGLRGMWGPLIVDPREPTQLDQEVTKEALLMFSGWNSKVADRFGEGGHPGETLDYFSINGKSFPLTQPLRVREGDVLRLRLLAATIDVAFHLHGHDLLVTHKDGLPLPAPFKADVLYIEQGARYDVIVRMNNPGLWIDHDHIEHHISNAGQTPGGAVLIVEYEDIEKPDWYVWKEKVYDPDFYLSESLTEGYGLFEHEGFRGAEIPMGR